jgi:diacylglycerol kinase (ATP)
MSVLIVHNPRSGRGAARPLVEQLDRALRADGHDVEIVEAGSSSVGHLLERSHAVALVGGDGTVHHALEDLARSRKPLIILPRGTENLLARELGMTADAERAARTIRAARTRDLDLGLVNSGSLRRRRFVVMLSAGPDASVIHRLDRARMGAISHASYIRPIIAEALRPALPRLVVDADGRRLVDGRQGLLVVANSRQYALRVDPAADADPTDGLLDVVFMPCATTLGAVAWLARSRLRRAAGDQRMVKIRARSVRIALAPGRSGVAVPPVQLDGEAVDAGPGPIEVGVEPGAFRVFDALYSGHARDRHRPGRDGQEALSGGDASVRRPAG